MMIEGSNMTCLFVPVSIIVVGHDIDNIKVLVELRYIVTVVNHLLSWGNSGSKQKSSGFEFSTQFSYKSSKVFFICGWSFFTVNLYRIEIFFTFIEELARLLHQEMLY